MEQSKNMNISLAEMPDEFFEDENGARKLNMDLMNGAHEEVLLHMNSEQLKVVLAFMESTGVFFGDDYSDGLDTPKDFLTHMHKFSPKQYADYIMLIAHLSEQEQKANELS